MRLPFSLIAFSLIAIAARAEEPAYDPLKVDAGYTVAGTDFTVVDAARQREIPLRIYLPAAKTPAPILLFSHGLGGSREGSAFLGMHWAKRGYAAVFLQHAGSDDAVWKNSAIGGKLAAMRNAASLENLLLRVKDVPAVIDQLENWNKTAGHALSGRLDPARVGMSGHSFGAVTTQAVSGQTQVGASFTDPRIKAALILSPSVPKLGDPKRAFGDVKLPWLLMTGTKDESPINNTTAESRLGVYPALPAGSKYELVLHNAEHSVFTERALPGEKQPRNPRHHPAILALSTAFWDAYLREDKAAREWLDGEKVRVVLEKEDRWQRK